PRVAELPERGADPRAEELRRGRDGDDGDREHPGGGEPSLPLGDRLPHPCSMQGAIAAGHPVTAEVGAQVLAAGGNAVDAAVAAGFASWVTESPLTGPGAGGFMLVHRARDRSTRMLDFFVATPGLGAGARPRAEMEAVDIDFSGESTQMFRIGSASCAVPGAVAGLATAHRRFGTLPWRTLFEPAVEAARPGVELTGPPACLHPI